MYFTTVKKSGINDKYKTIRRVLNGVFACFKGVHQNRPFPILLLPISLVHCNTQ